MFDLHTHTVFSDGSNTPEEMAHVAMALEMSTLGISDHSFTPWDPDYCYGMKDWKRQQEAIRKLGENRKGLLNVLCGVEQDYCCGMAHEGYDYVIGSVHYLPVTVEQAKSCGGLIDKETGMGYAEIDFTETQFISACNGIFGGDYYALAEAYYDCVARVVEVTGADIVGHFDLLAKFNASEHLFDEDNPRYVAAWKKAADAIIYQAETRPASKLFELLHIPSSGKEGVLVEINHAPVFRGIRDEAYPRQVIQDYFVANGVTLIHSSDSHTTRSLCFDFPEYA